jgi:hypothetical protein
MEHCVCIIHCRYNYNFNWYHLAYGFLVFDFENSTFVSRENVNVINKCYFLYFRVARLDRGLPLYEQFDL